MIKEKQINKKLEKQALKDQKKKEEEGKLEQQFSLKEVRADQPRRIGQTILRNKGIVRSRNAEISRVKLKKKYKEKTQKLISAGNKAVKKVVKEKDYSGEK